MKKIIIFILTIQIANANFLPETEYHDLETSSFVNSEKKKITQNLIHKLYDLYSDEVESLGGKLQISFLENDLRVNAFAKRKDGLWIIEILGGTVYHKYSSEEVIASILCHEMGHHLGGSPTKKSRQWVSVEGQADYYSANTCFKKVYENSNNEERVKEFKLNSFLTEKCKVNFQNITQQNLCFRQVLSNEMMVSFLYALKSSRRGRRGKKADLGKRDLSVRKSVMEEHPSSQCRIDTYIEGSLCNVFYDNNGKNCKDSDLLYKGSRPHCWFVKGN